MSDRWAIVKEACGQLGVGSAPNHWLRLLGRDALARVSELADALEAAERRVEELEAQLSELHQRCGARDAQEQKARAEEAERALQGLLNWYDGKPASSLDPHMKLARETLSHNKPSLPEEDKT